MSSTSARTDQLGYAGCSREVSITRATPLPVQVRMPAAPPRTMCLPSDHCALRPPAGLVGGNRNSWTVGTLKLMCRFSALAVGADPQPDYRRGRQRLDRDGEFDSSGSRRRRLVDALSSNPALAACPLAVIPAGADSGASQSVRVRVQLFQTVNILARYGGVPKAQLSPSPPRA